MTIHSAFLTALPTLGDRYISPYVEIQKVAVQGNAFDDPTDVTYEIRIRARQGYQIQLSEAPTDEFNITFTQRAGEAPREATKVTPASAEYDAFLAKLQTFHTDNPVITNDYVPVGRYTIPFGSNPGAVDYTDANVSNIFKIKFTVLQADGQPVPEQIEATVASAGEVSCFGECPQAQGGCWPMSGRIGQMPYGPYTHAISALEQDAYDIMGASGTPVYAPFVGELCGSSFSDWRYGKHATLKVDGVVYNGQTGSAYLIFAHLDSLNPEILNHQCIQVTSEHLRGGGYEIGKSGNTGNSFSPHLHYEARWNTLAVSGKSHPSLIEQMVPNVVVEQDPVRSCYDQ
jgi:murein DD-endopeptidase MepM/ murein hydrolase activator NlpD